MNNPYKWTPLSAIFERVLMSAMSIIFTESLKLKLCERWNVVVIKENRYIFSPLFQEHSNKAMEIISEMRKEDPYLKHVLSKL